MPIPPASPLPPIVPPPAPVAVQEVIKVPLVIAGSTLEGILYRATLPTVETFHRDFIGLTVETSRLDLKPPYQRQDNIWSDDKAAKLICSMINGLPIPPIYLCPTAAASLFFYPVDGLQRIKAISRFFAGDISIVIEIHRTNAEGTKILRRRVTWEEIRNEPQYRDIKHRILTYQIPVVELAFIPLESQRLLFVAINSGVPLNDDENNYCANFLARKFLDGIYADVFGSWTGILQPSCTENKRFKAAKVANELLLMIGVTKNDGEEITQGVHLFEEDEGEEDEGEEDEEQGKWVAPALRKGDRRQTATAMHDWLRHNGVQYHQPQQAFNACFDLARLPLLQNVANVIRDVFANNKVLGVDEKSNNKDYRQHRNVMDPLAFFYKKVENNELTVEQLTRHRGKINNLLGEYFRRKVVEQYNMSTSDAHMMTNKINLLEAIFNERDPGGWRV